jgi:hypothetical protein
MDAGGGNGDGARAPLLAGAGRRRNSVASMRGEFVSRLPRKVLDAVDPEHPSHVDFSRSKPSLPEGEARSRVAGQQTISFACLCAFFVMSAAVKVAFFFCFVCSWDGRLLITNSSCSRSQIPEL